MICGIVVMLGIFAALLMSTVVPQSALSQVASRDMTNQPSSAEMNTPSNATNATKLIIGPGGLLDPNIVIRDPSGDDIFAQNCIYRSEVYSNSATVKMAGGIVRQCFNGNWYPMA